MAKAKKNGRDYGSFACPICGRRETRTAPNQMFCQKCRRNEREKRLYKERLAAEALANMPMKGMSIVEVDRIAKALHLSYGRVVAEGLTKEKAAGATNTDDHGERRRCPT